MENNYWRSIEELQNGKPIDHDGEELDHKKEVLQLSKEELSISGSRRDFLKYFGFSVTAATVLAACERPVTKAIPYLVKPEEVIPGKSSYYASTYMDGSDYCSILVKVRDGRPIKIEGNELSSLTKGGTSARVQASVLSLYDSARVQFPVKEGKQISWETLDSEVISKLASISKSGGKIVLVTPSIYSPSTQAAIEQFKKGYPTVEHINYEAVSASALIEANQLAFGVSAIPNYKFQEADMVVGFNADFLGTWIFPLNYAPNYISKRRLTEGQKSMSYHVQFETNMTITGSKADKRVSIRTSDEKLILAALYNKLSSKLGIPAVSNSESPVNVDFLVDELIQNKGKSLVVSGSNELECQLLVNGINQLLENIGKTVDFSRPLYLKKNNDKEFTRFIEELNAGAVQGVILYNVNPAYDHPMADKFTAGLQKAQLTAGIYDRMNETLPLMQYVCATHHYLESWNDAEPQEGYISLAQPTIQNIFNTRHFQENLLSWSGNKQSYYDFVKAHWLTNIYPRTDSNASFDSFWTKALQDGILELPVKAKESVGYNSKPLSDALNTLKPSASKNLELHIYESIAIGAGYQANNPWLQELPDPVSKVTWENTASVSPKLASEKGWKEGSVIEINAKFRLPVVIQPGQAENSISVALGYGHTNMGKVANGLGVNVAPFLALTSSGVVNYSEIAKLDTTGDFQQLAQTQTHESMEGRPIVRETNLEEFLKDNGAGNEAHQEFEKMHHTLYDDPQYDGYQWGMSIDLNSCIGCSACAIACQSENNIPVVGKKQVTKRRIMHWIRIDRYYGGTPEKPSVFFQPVMCQHCSQAPCENVCPVSATNHSSEGLNQMAYNRCIGTKYCINNCPYKVRRFNWFRYVTNKAFDYNMNEDLGRMVLNPDVVVRERGVVEKCSFCVQRIQEKKLTAKLENRPLRDGELKTACMQACPTKAITFGNLKDPGSTVAKQKKDPRNYHLLEELHTLPSVGYLTIVKNEKV